MDIHDEIHRNEATSVNAGIDISAVASSAEQSQNAETEGSGTDMALVQDPSFPSFKVYWDVSKRCYNIWNPVVVVGARSIGVEMLEEKLTSGDYACIVTRKSSSFIARISKSTVIPEDEKVIAYIPICSIDGSLVYQYHVGVVVVQPVEDVEVITGLEFNLDNGKISCKVEKKKARINILDPEPQYDDIDVCGYADVNYVEDSEYSRVTHQFTHTRKRIRVIAEIPMSGLDRIVFTAQPYINSTDDRETSDDEGEDPIGEGGEGDEGGGIGGEEGGIGGEEGGEESGEESGGET